MRIEGDPVLEMTGTTTDLGRRLEYDGGASFIAALASVRGHLDQNRAPEPNCPDECRRIIENPKQHRLRDIGAVVLRSIKSAILVGVVGALLAGCGGIEDPVSAKIRPDGSVVLFSCDSGDEVQQLSLRREGTLIWRVRLVEARGVDLSEGPLAAAVLGSVPGYEAEGELPDALQVGDSIAIETDSTSSRFEITATILDGSELRDC